MPESGRTISQLPLSVLVTTYNEEANIARCLKSVRWADEVFVVDSFSTDRTVQIAQSKGAKTYQRRFVTCDDQWNWALDNLPFSNEWVLVLDADEQIPPALAAEIARVLADGRSGRVGYFLKRRFFFLGRCLKRGGLYPTWILRFFKRGAGRFGRHGISEHLILNGPAGYLQCPFDHRDNKPLKDWIERHNRYSELEADEYVRGKLGISQAQSIIARLRGNQAERKQWIKLHVWNRLPLFLRPFIFFFRNYLLRGGFLDGREGFIYHVLWSFWVRFLIDVKILERQRRRGCAGLATGRPALEAQQLSEPLIPELDDQKIHGHADR
jgi:glycosyltransferase involved in cell wall biosynthesis